MNPIEPFLSRYPLDSVEDGIQALREIIQEIALLGLWRSHFFEHAAFYGGSALRILYKLNRYSEDLDFSLIKPEPLLDFSPYYKAIVNELLSFGFEADISTPEKKNTSAVKSAFIKMNTRISILNIGLPPALANRIQHNQRLKIKIEVDSDPPAGADTNIRFQSLPQAYSVKAYNLESMLAGKIHALIARNWQGRVKGRDWYDLAWFMGREVPVNTPHLIRRLEQTGHLDAGIPDPVENIITLLSNVVENLDIQKAREDVLPFLQNKSETDVWSRDFFHHMISLIKFR